MLLSPAGAIFKLPLALLWQHRHDMLVWRVVEAKPTSTGINIVAQLAKIAEEGELKNLADKAWQSIKYGLVSSFSIGFSSIEAEPFTQRWH
jgi:hypothetical protein